MRLQMLQKPPVIFTQYEPARAISAEDEAFAKQHSDAIPWLWLSYSRHVLEDNEPCMEPNEGLELTIAYALQYKALKELKVKRLDAQSALAHFNIIQKMTSSPWSKDGNELLILPSILTIISNQSINAMKAELENMKLAEDSDHETAKETIAD